MAVNLTNTWNQHAFPDDAPGREERWSLDFERRRVADRTDFDLEQSGSTNKIHRFTSGQNDELNGKSEKKKAADDDMMVLLAVGSPAYMEAYNNKLTFQIGGEDFEITQGQLHDLAKRRAEDLHQQIDAAKRRGASADEIVRMQSEWMATTRIADNTDPQGGMMDDDRLAAVRDDLEHTPGLVDAMKRRGTSPASARELSRMDFDGETLAELTVSQDRKSVANAIEDSPIAALDVAPRRDFAAAATNAPVPEEQAPTAPSQVPGFNLG